MKGAIDSRIAEEQARHRALQNASPSRSSSVSSRSGARDSSPAVRSRANRPLARNNGDEPSKGPDPQEFEPEFVIDDDDAPSRTLTPQPSRENNGTATTGDASNDGSSEANSESTTLKGDEDGQATKAPPELPSDVRVKLRKLERLEARYQGTVCARAELCLVSLTGSRTSEILPDSARPRLLD